MWKHALSLVTGIVIGITVSSCVVIITILDAFGVKKPSKRK